MIRCRRGQINFSLTNIQENKICFKVKKYTMFMRFYIIFLKISLNKKLEDTDLFGDIMYSNIIL